MTLKEALKKARETKLLHVATPKELHSATNTPNSATTACNRRATKTTKATKSLGYRRNRASNNHATKQKKPCNKPVSEKPNLLHVLHGEALTPARRIYEAYFGGLEPEPEPVAKVWHAEIDGHRLTIIDPQQYNNEQMRHYLVHKFGGDRIGRIDQWRGYARNDD